MCLLEVTKGTTASEWQSDRNKDKLFQWVLPFWVNSAGAQQQGPTKTVSIHCLITRRWNRDDKGSIKLLRN